MGFSRDTRDWYHSPFPRFKEQQVSGVGSGTYCSLGETLPSPARHLPDVESESFHIQKAIPDPGWLVNAYNPSIGEVKEGG